jgi:peptide/nickel transport system permease protein
MTGSVAHLEEELAGQLDGVASREPVGHATWRTLRRHPGFRAGAAILAVLVLASLLAPWIAPYAPSQEFRELLPPTGQALQPSERFLLGTDVGGHDYLTLLLYAGRPTLLVAFGANIAAVFLGTLVGLVAGYAGTVTLASWRGRHLRMSVDSTLMRITDIGLAFPALLLAIAATAVLGRSLVLVGVVIAAVLWTTTARIVYSRTLQVASADFVMASQALGSSTRRILRRSILPHVMPIVVVLFALGVSSTILFEAALSFLGAGAPAKEATWGRILSDQLRWYENDIRLPLLPGLLIALTVLACNLIGDACRDALDPRTARR